MSILNAAFLGFIQGVAEFLPISSSGHLAMLQNIFNMQTAEDGHMFFDVLLHFGTLLAIIIVYWKDIVYIVSDTVGLVLVGVVMFLQYMANRRPGTVPAGAK